MYPSAIPTSVSPNMAERDVEDLRKVLILGGDDSATVGCINGLRQFGFQG
jgi:arginase family enzyme